MPSRAVSVLLVAAAILAQGAVSTSTAATAAPTASAVSPAVTTPRSTAAARAQCFGGYFTPRHKDATTAKALMAGRLTLSPHPSTLLPANPTWRENPFRDPNWTFQLHTLRWADVLRREGIRTKNQAMLHRHAAILSDWLRDNPRSGAPSPMSWNDMATGIRTIVFSCAIASYGYRPQYAAALRNHGSVLVNPKFGARRGNHALHVRIGLLVAGCVGPNRAWSTAARSRIQTVLRGSVDAQGVSDEGAARYALANYTWYLEAKRRIRACGLAPGSTFARVAKMPEFLAQATTPDGTYEQIGDSDRSRAVPIAGSPHSVYAATGGTEGTRPTTVYQPYQRGYVFGRSGWGRSRPLAHELFYSLRFGAPLGTQIHGHEDAGALTLNADGRKLLFDAGRYRYDSSALSRHLQSRAAHNTVDVRGARYNPGARTVLVASRHTAAYDLTTVRVTALTGTTWTRTVLYSRTGRYLVVDDTVLNKRSATMVQRWNLPENGTRRVRGSALSVDTPGADMSMIWVGAKPRISVAAGRKSPLSGWRSYAYGTAFAAPVAHARLTGRTGRFTTVIVPRADSAPGPRPSVTSVRFERGWIELTVSAGGKAERVRMSARAATVRAR
jgi:hypothetical protein